MTNPNDAVGTNAAYGGRTSVNAFNDSLGAFSRGILSGWVASAGGGMSVDVGGDGTTRDIAVAQDNIGNKTTVNNISGSPINVPIATAPASNSRIDAIVVYVDSPASGVSTVADNPSACGIIAVAGTPAASPTTPTDADIRTAITADGASGSTAYYAVIAQITVAANVTVIDAGAISQSNALYATVGQNNFRVNSINGSKLQDLSITNAKLGGAIVKSFNIDWSTMPERYTLTEINTGYTWIDGSTIYKKTISIGALPNSATKTTAHGITNLSAVVRIEGIVLDPRMTIWLPLPLVYEGDSSGYNVSVYVSTTSVAVKSTSDRSMLTPAYVTIYYTKSGGAKFVEDEDTRSLPEESESEVAEDIPKK